MPGGAGCSISHRFFLESMRIFFFRPTSYAMRHAALAHCHANDFCATTKEASDVDVLDLRTRAWEKDSGTSTRLSQPFLRVFGFSSSRLFLAAFLFLSPLVSRLFLVSSLASLSGYFSWYFLVISTSQTPSSFTIVSRKTAI